MGSEIEMTVVSGEESSGPVPLIRPDFIIVGAMKAGTTTLAKQLNSHPEIGLARREVHYFSREDYFSKGDHWYTRRLASAARRGATLIGEKSACYAYSPIAPERIHAYCPNVRLLWVLRNPVDRAYSHYLHRLKQGGESLPFVEAVARRRNAFLRRSDYLTQVKRFLEHFPLEQLHFTIFDDLADPNRDHLGPVLQFLGVRDTTFRPKIESANQTVLPRFPSLLRSARRVLDPNGKSYARLQNLLKGGTVPGYPPLEADVRRSLIERFRSHNDALGTLLGRDLSAWNE